MDTNAQLQSIRDACKRGSGGRAIDQFTELDNHLTAKGAVAVPAPWKPKFGAALVQACHDDSEECTYCAFPEHAPAVLTVTSTAGTVHVCRTHVERGLTDATGARFDRGEVPDPPYFGLARGAQAPRPIDRGDPPSLRDPVVMVQPDGTSRTGEADDVRALIGYLDTNRP